MLMTIRFQGLGEFKIMNYEFWVLAEIHNSEFIIPLAPNTQSPAPS